MKLRKLMPHQLQALRWAMPRKTLALFMEMRLGKTAVAIRWVKHTAPARNEYRVLVVGPLTVLPAWEDELLKEGVPADRAVYLTGDKKKRTAPLIDFDWGWYLTNYEALRSSPVMLRAPWTHIILDESTRIRNPKAQITKLLTNNNFLNKPCRAILSGFPAPEGMLDYFCQMRFLEDEFMGKRNYYEFRQRYFRQYGYDWWCPPKNRKQILEAIRSKAFVLTRKEAKLGSKKIYETRTIEPTPLQKKLTEKIKKEFAYGEQKEQETKWNVSKLQWLGRVAGGFDPEGNLIGEGKVKEILTLLQGELKREKVVIWFRYTKEIHSVVHFLRRNRILAEPITGEFSPEERRKTVKKFQTSKSLRVICVQGKCAPYGLDFSAASTAIYYSNWYDGEIRVQSEDRIVHPKKKEPVLYIDLVTKGSTDVHAVRLLKKKKLSSKMFLHQLQKEVLNDYKA